MCRVTHEVEFSSHFVFYAAKPINISVAYQKTIKQMLHSHEGKQKKNT